MISISFLQVWKLSRIIRSSRPYRCRAAAEEAPIEEGGLAPESVSILNARLLHSGDTVRLLGTTWRPFAPRVAYWWIAPPPPVPPIAIVV